MPARLRPTDVALGHWHMEMTHLAIPRSGLAAILRALFAFAMLAASIFTLAHPARAAGKPSVVVVFDGSGSMWGRIDGTSQPKFELARSALRAALAKAAPKIDVGLVTFGLQARGGCTFAELVIPPGTEDAASLAPLSSFNPKGRGPLVLGLRRAGEALKNLPAPRRIILIHDDPDNCDQNVCQAAKELKAAMPDLTIHSVSLATHPEDVDAMACVAKTTDGTAANTENEEEAIAAIERAVALSVAPGKSGGKVAGPAPSAPQAVPAPSPVPGLSLSAVLAPGTPALDEGVTWHIKSADAKDAPERVLSRARPSIPLKPGRYTVKAIAGGLTQELSVVVPDGPRTRAELNLDAAAIRFAAPLTRGGGTYPDAVLELTRPDDTTGAKPVWLGRPDDAPLILKAGSYIASVHAGDVRRRTAIKVTAGDRRLVEIPLNAGQLTLEAQTDDTANPGNILFTIEGDDPQRSRGRRTIARSASHTPRFLVPAGTYYITARHGTAVAEELIAVPPGNEVASTLDLRAMTLQIKARLKGSDTPPETETHHTVWRIDGDKQPIAESSGTDPVFRLTRGRYRVRSQLGLQNATIVRDFEVSAGQAGELVLEHEAGSVRLSLNAAATALDGSDDVYWRILDSRGQPIWRSAGKRPQAILKTGTYVVLADVGQSQFRDTVVVTTGQRIDLRIGPQ